MKQQELSKATNPDLSASLIAMRRAAQTARRIAVQTDTAIVLVKHGKPVRITAQRLRESDTAFAKMLSAMPDVGTDEDFARKSR